MADRRERVPVTDGPGLAAAEVPEASPATILVADDLPRTRLLLRRTLELARYAVLEAADGDESLALLVAHRPRLAILDVAMPGRTGLEVCRAIRADPALAGTPVLVLTSSGLERDALMAGADAFVAKPFSPLRLLDVVAGLLRRGEEGLVPRSPRGRQVPRACWNCESPVQRAVTRWAPLGGSVSVSLCAACYASCYLPLASSASESALSPRS